LLFFSSSSACLWCLRFSVIYLRWPIFLSSQLFARCNLWLLLLLFASRKYFLITLSIPFTFLMVVISLHLLRFWMFYTLILSSLLLF
jgi:hypothetical protein